MIATMTAESKRERPRAPAPAGRVEAAVRFAADLAERLDPAARGAEADRADRRAATQRTPYEFD